MSGSGRFHKGDHASFSSFAIVGESSTRDLSSFNKWVNSLWSLGRSVLASRRKQTRRPVVGSVIGFLVMEAVMCFLSKGWSLLEESCVVIISNSESPETSLHISLLGRPALMALKVQILTVSLAALRMARVRRSFRIVNETSLMHLLRRKNSFTGCRLAVPSEQVETTRSRKSG